MKKILYGLLILISFFSLTGCVKEKTKTADKTQDIKDKIKVGDNYFVLDRESKTKDLVYKYSFDFTVGGYNNFLNISYGDGDEKLFVIRIVYFENEDMNSALSQLSSDNITTYDKEINGIIWKTFSFHNDNVNVDYKGYMYNYNSDTYVVMFNSIVNIDDLEKDFMNNISFK